MKQIWSIVITGGPCSGKTTALSTIEQELTNKGYYVLTVPETATELISSGIRPFENCMSLYEFQYFVFEKQINKENLYKKAAKKVPAEKVVILFDRGIIDNKGYVTKEEYKTLLANFNLNERTVRDRYDAVFHLVTAAEGAEEYYSLDNNNARTETPEQARKLDREGMENWTGHPHFRVIDNAAGFDGKMKMLMKEIYTCLNEPIPIEIERKYLIEKPDLEKLSKQVSITKIDIVEMYLKHQKGVERRIRKRGQEGNNFYYLAEKREIDIDRVVEAEKRITEEEYANYLLETDSELFPIEKQRVSFIYKGQYFQIDIFDEEFSQNEALMKLELTSENNEIELPDFIKVLREVTYDPKYRNYSLAKNKKI